MDLDELFKKTCCNKYVPGIELIEGTVLGYRYNEMKEEIDNLEVNDDDVFVITYPKSGTTWTQELVWLLANNFDYECAKSTELSKRFPNLELEMIYDINELSKLHVPVPFVHNSIEYVKNFAIKPRCIKTHLPWNLLPKSIQTYENRPKIVYVLRDPKDVCTSYYHFYKSILFYSGNFEEFCTLFLNDKLGYAPYWHQIESYWNQRNESNILILRYSDLKKDLRCEVLKVAKFLDKTIPDDQMEKYLKHLSFDSMKANHSINFTFAENGRDHIIRKGIIGDHKNTMTSEIIAKFDEWIAKNNKYGITF